MKYAYIYEVYRHVYNFVGPIDSYEEMMKYIARLATGDDEEAHAAAKIKDYLNYGNYLEEEDYDDLVYDVGLKIFKVEEVPIDNKTIVESWKNTLDESRRSWEEQVAKQQEERDKREYERLKKKFGNDPG